MEKGGASVAPGRSLVLEHERVKRLAKLTAAAIAAGGLCASAATAAPELRFECQVQASRPDAGFTHWRRRIVLTAADHLARYFDDTGQGMKPKSQHRFVSVSRTRIVLDAGDGKTSFIDRLTGDYVLRNQRQRFELHGRCRPG